MVKKILITGENSYIGNKLETWLAKMPEKYKVTKSSVRNQKWKLINFMNYDTVIHVAGLAHTKEKKTNENSYYKINRDLTSDIAIKAKAQNIKHFIFLSSMSVYGVDNGVISEQTKPHPKNSYGKSKLQAEEFLQTLSDDNFKVAIIRPPMVYGEGCKGNFSKLAKMAKITPLFPNVKNERSMIYIDNLTEFMRLLVDNSDKGLYFPQNKEYVNSSELVKLIGEIHNKKIYMVKIFNVLLRRIKSNNINKVFGSLTYDKSLSQYGDYQCYDFKESIILSERKSIIETN